MTTSSSTRSKNSPSALSSTRTARGFVVNACQHAQPTARSGGAPAATRTVTCCGSASALSQISFSKGVSRLCAAQPAISELQPTTRAPAPALSRLRPRG